MLSAAEAARRSYPRLVASSLSGLMNVAVFGVLQSVCPGEVFPWEVFPPQVFFGSYCVSFLLPLTKHTDFLWLLLHMCFK